MKVKGRGNRKSTKYKNLDDRIIDCVNEGKSYQEVCRLLGVLSVGYVSSVVERNKHRIKRVLAPKGTHYTQVTVQLKPLYFPSKGTTLDKLGEKECHWPLSDEANADTLYCGKPGYPYCDYHTMRARGQRQRA
jgi:hypothetical protein